MITINGNSFGYQESDLTVLAAGNPCLIKNLTNTQIICQVSPGETIEQDYYLSGIGAKMELKDYDSNFDFGEIPLFGWESTAFQPEIDYKIVGHLPT